MWTLNKINKALSGAEWRISLGIVVWGWLAPAGSFILPAWAAEASGVFAEYAPLSWVVAGFLGLLTYAVARAVHGYGSSKYVRSLYDARFLQETGGVDPLAKVFEGKRIYLNDLVLPSQPQVIGKTFVDCEIVGPANMYLEMQNSVDDVQAGMVDAVALSGERQFYNGVLFRNCKFVGCTFHRVTLFFEPSEAVRISNLNWLNWISPMPNQASLPGTVEPSLISDQSDQSPTENGVEKPR